MDLQKLFEMQKKLDAHIEKEHPRKDGEDRLSKKILALLTELGEIANEWRGFKFWSNDQNPRTDVITVSKTTFINGLIHEIPEHRNLLIEEFVDGLHFVLSIGLEIQVKSFEVDPIKKGTITEQFLVLYNSISFLKIIFTPFIFGKVFSAYLGLGEMLGFTWEDVEQAYFAKNKINHQRQEEGY